MKKILFILSLLLYTCNIPAFSQNTFDNYSYIKHKEGININYDRIEQSVWNKYFKAQGKILKQNWKNNKEMFQPPYKTSYVRILFFVNRQGEILSYKIKSSCIPYGDAVFIEQVNKTIKAMGKFEELPYEYRHDFIPFTVKFHAQLPQKMISKKLDEERFGVADIEIDKRKVFTIIK